MRTKTKNSFTSVLKEPILKDVRKGQTLLKESPFVFGLKANLRHERCDFCFTREKVLKCSGCKYVSYCNRNCQKVGWEMHKDECSRLKKICPRVLPDAARILSRIIFKLKRGGGLECSYYTKKNYRFFKDLMSHYSDIKEDSKRMEHFTALYNVLKEFIGEDELPNSAELLGLYGRLVVNGFSILDSEMVGIGTGIYLAVSIIDHSCRPNATAVFQGTTIYIHSLTDMPDFDWSRVFITYIELLNSPEEREQELMATYYFLCECSRCKDIEELNLSRSMMCQNETCKAPVTIANKVSPGLVYCNKCEQAIKPDRCRQYLETYDFVSQQLLKMKDFAYMDIAKLCLEKQEDLFHPLNLLRVKTLDAAFESSVSVNLWNDARGYGELLLPGFKHYYGELHPLTGLLQLKLAKICLYVGDNERALSLLQEAQTILSITHGRDHPLFSEQILPLITQLYSNN